MDIAIMHNCALGYYISIDVYGIFAESKWYKTKEKLAFAMATNTIKWATVSIETDLAPVADLITKQQIETKTPGKG